MGVDTLTSLTHGIILLFIHLMHLIEGNEELVLMVFLRCLAKSSQK